MTRRASATANRPRPVLAVAGALATVAALAAGWPLVEDTTAAPDITHAAEQVLPAVTVTGADLLDQVDQLPLEDGGAPVEYERDAFGSRWADVDANGCDTRNDVLARDLLDVEVRPGTRDCVVERGVLHDLYTGETITFEKTTGGIDIDHLVPLAAAWHAGAWAWTDEQRAQFANDPSNLQATSSSANRSKGDRGPEAWMPPEAGYGCAYVGRWVEVKATWALSVTSTEHAALREIAATC